MTNQNAFKLSKCGIEGPHCKLYFYGPRIFQSMQYGPKKRSLLFKKRNSKEVE